VSFGLFIFATYVKKTMNKDKLTDYKAEATPSGGVLIGKRDGQTMIHNKGSLSGYLVGRTHAEGGIKAINKSTGQPLEMQGGEVVITAPAVSDTTKREFEGKMMTNREILSEINKRGGGVSFSDGGDIPTEMHFSGSSYAFGGKTLSDHEIAYEISKCGCEHESYNEGGKIDQMPISVKKKVYTADGERKITPVAISILTDYVNALPQTKELNTDSKGNYTKERQELHQKIINDFKDELICIQKDEPIAILMGGSPASGKSTFLKKYAPYLLKEEILKVDADEIRSMLPEYKGYNATQTHLETKDIVNTLLSDKTIGIPCKYDIIYDGTMNSTKSYLPLISLLKSLGYKIFIVYVDKVPEEVVKKRALERYKKSGRFVPMEIIDDFFSKGKTALEELKSKADGYMIIDGSNGDYNVLERKGIRLPKTRAYSKLGQPISKLEKMANGGSLTKGMSLKQIAKMHGVTLLELNRQVKMGLDAESEHTSKVTEQMRIVKDHLYENPNYYTLLKEAGLEKGGGIEKWKKLTEYNLIPALGTTEEYKSYVYKNAKIYYSKIDREWLLEINHKIIKGYPTLAVAKKRAEMMLLDTNNPDIRYDGGGGIDSFLNYYLEELKDFLKNQNDINLKDDYTFFYKGENFKIEPIIVSNTSSIKEASFVIYDSDDEIVGNIEFNPNSNKEFIANSQFFEWNNINFEDGGLNSNEYDVDYFEDYKKGGEVDYVTYKDKYNKKYNYDKNTSHDLEEISKDTGVSLKGLQQIYNKGIGAYKTNPSSVRPNVNSKEQWAMARVYSAVMGGKASNVDSNELKMNYGGNVKDSLVRDAKSGNSPSRDLNNYNDLIDVQADGAVGGDIGIYANGGRLGTSGLPLVDYIEIINGGSYLKNLKNKDKFYDFQSLKKRVAEEYKLLPSTPSNIYRGYIEVQAYDTEGNELVAPNTSISDMKNTVKNFNPYTGKPSDLEKSFAKSRPISFKKYDWSEWFSGKKSMPTKQVSSTLTLSKQDLENIKIKINSDFDLALKVVEKLEQFGFTDTSAIRRRIDRKDNKFGIYTNNDDYVGWHDNENDFNIRYDKKEIFPSDLGIGSSASATTSTAGLVEIPDGLSNFDGKVLSLPNPILELLVFRVREQGVNQIGIISDLKIRDVTDVDGNFFSFGESKEGFGFWDNIADGNFKEFKKLYGKYGEKVKDIVGTPSTTQLISISKFSSAEIKLFEAIDDIVKENNLNAVSSPIIVFGLSGSRTIKDFDLVKEDTSEVFLFRAYDKELGLQKYDTNKDKSRDLLEDYIQWKNGGSSSVRLSASATTSTAGLVEIPDGISNFDGEVLSLPNPILELLLFRAREQGVNQIGNISVLNIRGVIDVDGISFNFDESKEGFTFWDNIAKGDFKKFKELYGKYGEKVKDIVGTPSTPATTSKTLSKEDLKKIKIKINSDFDLALKVVEKLEEFGFTNTDGIKRKIKYKEQFHSIWRGTGNYVGWFENEDNFNDSDNKEIFPSDLGINTSTTIAQTQTSQSNTPSNQDKKISNEYVADDSVLRKNYILGSASLRKDRDDLDALVKLLPSFNQSKFAVEKATILKEMARLQKKLDYWKKRVPEILLSPFNKNSWSILG
jgi:predicted ABC-type ATPase